MGNESSTQQQQRSGIWTLARDGRPGGLRASIDQLAGLRPAEKAAYIDWQDEADRRTPLAMAALMGAVECVRMLLINGADASLVGRDGMGPLHLAVKSKGIAIVNLLMRNRRVDCNVVDARGYTPLHLAAILGYAQVLQALLACERIDVFARHKNNGLNVLQLARRAYLKANASDRPRFKESMTLVEKVRVHTKELVDRTCTHALIYLIEQRLLVASGYLFEFVNRQSASKCAWKERYDGIEYRLSSHSIGAHREMSLFVATTECFKPRTRKSWISRSISRTRKCPGTKASAYIARPEGTLLAD